MKNNTEMDGNWPTMKWVDSYSFNEKKEKRTVTTDSNNESYTAGLNAIVRMRLGETEWRYQADDITGTLLIQGKDPSLKLQVRLVLSPRLLIYYIGNGPSYVLLEDEAATTKYNEVLGKFKEDSARDIIEKLNDPHYSAKQQELEIKQQRDKTLKHIDYIMGTPSIPSDTKLYESILKDFYAKNAVLVEYSNATKPGGKL